MGTDFNGTLELVDVRNIAMHMLLWLRNLKVCKYVTSNWAIVYVNKIIPFP